MSPNGRKLRKPYAGRRTMISIDFLGWTPKLDRGKNSQKLKQIHKASSLMTEWKNLRLYYQRLTQTQINEQDSKEILTKEDAGVYRRYRSRIQVCLFNSLALFTVHRQNAL
ncbi:unnamed protein product [Aspergillus oryzae RIB40]|uniref:DNA, SC102 n=1 Tax=Aspergillus oryzae (strain ATCC 42149 / RIB 40) TaxID=510516 RepID=Q2UAE8_ASPOR|nr:unnamed protein product [Aspergillus oryzae RIB40]BAE61467.1 unnamed protein product [Aspergillus oryzae RIB40]